MLLASALIATTDGRTVAASSLRIGDKLPTWQNGKTAECAVTGIFSGGTHECLRVATDHGTLVATADFLVAAAGATLSKFSHFQRIEADAGAVGVRLDQAAALTLIKLQKFDDANDLWKPAVVSAAVKSKGNVGHQQTMDVRVDAPDKSYLLADGTCVFGN